MKRWRWRVVLEHNVESKWTGIKDAFCETAKEVLGYRTKKGKSWISSDSWKGNEERRQLKRKALGQSRKELEQGCKRIIVRKIRKLREGERGTRENGLMVSHKRRKMLLISLGR